MKKILLIIMLMSFPQKAGAEDVGVDNDDYIQIKRVNFKSYEGDLNHIVLLDDEDNEIVIWQPSFLDPSDYADNWEEGEIFDIVQYKYGVSGLIRESDGQFIKVYFHKYQFNPITFLKQKCFEMEFTTSGMAGCAAEGSKRWEKEYRYLYDRLKTTLPSDLVEDLQKIDDAWLQYRDNALDTFVDHYTYNLGSFGRVQYGGFEAALAYKHFHLLTHFDGWTKSGNSENARSEDVRGEYSSNQDDYIQIKRVSFKTYKVNVKHIILLDEEDNEIVIWQPSFTDKSDYVMEWQEGEVFDIVQQRQGVLGLTRESNGRFIKVYFYGFDLQPIKILEQKCLDRELTINSKAGCTEETAKRWEREHHYFFDNLKPTLYSDLAEDLQKIDDAWQQYQDYALDTFYKYYRPNLGSSGLVEYGTFKATLTLEHLFLLTFFDGWVEDSSKQ